MANNNKLIFGLVFMIVILAIGIFAPTQFVDAKKSEGTSYPVTNSKQVCGDRLCDAPLSIEEKITQYLLPESGSAELGRPGGTSQQALGIPADSLLGASGEYYDKLLKFTIVPSLDWKLDIHGDSDKDRLLVFTSEQSYDVFPSFFTIHKVMNQNDAKINSDSKIDTDALLSSYVSGLEKLDYIKEVQNESINVKNFDDKIQINISGTLILDLVDGELPVKFETAVVITNGGEMFIASFNSGAKEYFQSSSEFKRSLDSLTTDMMTTSQNKQDSMTEPTPQPKSTPEKTTPTPTPKPTPSPETQPKPTPSPETQPKPTPSPETKPPTTTKSILKVPSWIKDNAKWWGNSQIRDQDFTRGIEYMMEKGIINIPDIENVQVTGTQAGEPVIPEWVKFNAKWWSEDKITEQDFVLGIEWLVKEGIISV